MTYTAHCGLALWLSGQLAVASAASFVHAFVPDVFVRTTSQILDKLMRVMRDTGCRHDDTLPL